MSLAQPTPIENPGSIPARTVWFGSRRRVGRTYRHLEAVSRSLVRVQREPWRQVQKRYGRRIIHRDHLAGWDNPQTCSHPDP